MLAGTYDDHDNVSQDLLNANNWWLRIQPTDVTEEFSENLKISFRAELFRCPKTSLNQPAAVFLFL